MKPIRFATAKEAGTAVQLDIQKLIDTRLLLQANSGGGKSYALRKFLEVTHGHIQHLVIDAEGEFNSLRERFEYVYIAKGEKIQPDPSTAAQLATMLLELGTSAILDIYELHPRDRKRFVRTFLEAVVDANKNLWHPCLIVIDEAHEFAPEAERSESLEAVVALETKGRKREFCGVLATQRFSKLNKDAAAELQNKIIGLGNYEIDRARSGDELGFTKQERLKLRDLEPGEMYVTGPAFFQDGKRIKEPVLVQIDEVTTPHGRKAKRWHAPKGASAGRIRKTLEALAALPKRAEEEGKTIADLQRQLREVKQELAQAHRGIPKTDSKIQEELKELRESHSRWEKTMKEIRQFKNRLLTKLQEIGAMVNSLPDEAESVKISGSVPLTMVHQPTEIRYRAPLKGVPKPEVDGRSFGQCERKILGFLSLRPGQYFTKVQVGAMTGYSHGSGGFNNALSNLSQAGLITRNGGSVALNPTADISDLVDKTPHRLEDWIAKLGACERRVYELLLTESGKVLSKEEVAEVTGYSAGSGGFNNALSRLSTLGLIKRHHGGRVGLNDEITGL